MVIALQYFGITYIKDLINVINYINHIHTGKTQGFITVVLPSSFRNILGI